MSNRMPLLRKNTCRGFTKLAKHFRSAKQVMAATRLAKLACLKLAKHLGGTCLKLAKHLGGTCLKLAKHLGGAKQVMDARCLAGAILIASMLPNLLKSQTVDQGTIQTTDNQTEWTTGKIETPRVNWLYNGAPLSIFSGFEAVP